MNSIRFSQTAASSTAILSKQNENPRRSDCVQAAFERALISAACKSFPGGHNTRCVEAWCNKKSLSYDLTGSRRVLRGVKGVRVHPKTKPFSKEWRGIRVKMKQPNKPVGKEPKCQAINLTMQFCGTAVNKAVWSGLSNIPEHTHYSDCNECGARVDLFAYDNTLMGNWLGCTCIVLCFMPKQNWAHRSCLFILSFRVVTDATFWIESQLMHRFVWVGAAHLIQPEFSHKNLIPQITFQMIGVISLLAWQKNLICH